ncbi:unnamed protein product [Effrenium voratum]|nr:unnamed protein product [Effrenium voratum]
MEDLLPTLLHLWPESAEKGQFIWVLDPDFNFIVAPSWQRANLLASPKEVKHGDLVPGENFFGHNGLAGPYRGVARLGGEFNLDGSEWVMHAKSGYTAYRVPVATAADYYHVQKQAGRNETAIARNFQRCVYRQIYRVREALSRTFCFLRRHFGVRMTLGEFRQCDIRSSAAGSNLQHCLMATDFLI